MRYCHAWFPLGLSLLACGQGGPTEPLLPPVPVPGIAALDADTLRFGSEAAFERFLRHHGRRSYTVADAPPPTCRPLPEAANYPAQNPQDYLFEARFAGLPNVVIFDHIVTRKMLNVFLPGLADARADFCDVQLGLTHPVTGQVVIFEDIFRWVDDQGRGLFNLNKKLHFLWGFADQVVEFELTHVHLPTGYDYTFVADFPGHATMTLRFGGVLGAF